MYTITYLSNRKPACKWAWVNSAIGSNSRYCWMGFPEFPLTCGSTSLFPLGVDHVGAQFPWVGVTYFCFWFWKKAPFMRMGTVLYSNLAFHTPLRTDAEIAVGGVLLLLGRRQKWGHDIAWHQRMLPSSLSSHCWNWQRRRAILWMMDLRGRPGQCCTVCSFKLYILRWRRTMTIIQ